jgi:hypothetical protein
MPWKYPQTTYEQRKEFYGDIESLINPGFLSHKIQIDTSIFSLRSLYPSDLFLLSHRINDWNSDHEWKTWWVASSVWMVNGINLLEEIHAVNSIYNSLSRLPKNTINVLYSISLGLSSRLNKALEGIESYCYENVSRMTWKQQGKKIPIEITGIPGVQKLGLNTVQKIWISYNVAEDESQLDQMNWQHAKMIASASAPKGVEKINDREEKLKEEQEEKKQDIKDFYFYKCLGLLSDKDINSSSKKETFRISKTVEELEEEMRRWVSGDLDQHDLIVQEYKNKVRRDMEEAKQQRHDAWEETRAEHIEEDEYLPPMPLTGYTSEQVKSMISSKKKAKASKFVYQDSSNHPDKDRLYQKYLNKDPNVGSLSVVDGKIVDTSKLSLQDKINTRKVSLSGEKTDG